MKTDAKVKADVTNERQWDPSINAAHVGVSARSDVVTLSGHLDTCAEKHAIELDVKLAPNHLRSGAEKAVPGRVDSWAGRAAVQGADWAAPGNSTGVNRLTVGAAIRSWSRHRPPTPAPPFPSFPQRRGGFRQGRSLQQELLMNDLRLNDLFDLDPLETGFRSLLRPWRFEVPDRAPQIRLDVTESDGLYLVKADIPGVRKEDIDVRIDGNQVTISAEIKQEKEEGDGGRVLRSERQYGFASRSFALADAVDDAKADARFEDGVLKLSLPKRAAASHKRLAIA